MELKKNSKLVNIVPWYSLEEYQDVFTYIYSDDPIKQKRGCEMILAWKTRHLKVPVGADCTFSFIQAQLKDNEQLLHIQQGRLPLADKDYEIRVLYSIAIMRFLNHIFSTSNNQDSLYHLAKLMNIPDFIINVRNMIAHSSQLPTKDIMNYCSQWCLTWLKENFWKIELTNTKDLFDDTHFESNEVNSKILTTIKKKKSLLLNKSQTHIDQQIIPSINIISLFSKSHTPQFSIQFLGKYLKVFLKKSLKFSKNKTINLILNMDLFFPKEEMSIPNYLIKLYNNVIILLHKHNCLHLFIEKLLTKLCSSNSFHIIYISKWLREIFSFLHKINIMLISFSKLSNNRGEISEISLKKKNIILENIYMTSSITENQLKYYLTQCLINPNEHSHLYMKSLFQLAKSWLSKETRTKLLLLLKIYLNKDSLLNETNNDEQIKSLSDIPSSVTENEDFHEEEKNSENLGFWQRSYDCSILAELPFGYLYGKSTSNLKLNTKFVFEQKTNSIEYNFVFNKDYCDYHNTNIEIPFKRLK